VNCTIEDCLCRNVYQAYISPNSKFGRSTCGIIELLYLENFISVYLVLIIYFILSSFVKYDQLIIASFFNSCTARRLRDMKAT
jgi:hypothetical protein